MVAEQEVDKLLALIFTLWGYHKCLTCLTENTVDGELTEQIVDRVCCNCHT